MPTATATWLQPDQLQPHETACDRMKPQAFEPEVLDWDEFAVVVRHDQVSRLPQLLDALRLWETHIRR